MMIVSHVVGNKIMHIANKMKNLDGMNQLFFTQNLDLIDSIFNK